MCGHVCREVCRRVCIGHCLIGVDELALHELDHLDGDVERDRHEVVEQDEERDERTELI